MPSVTCSSASPGMGSSRPSGPTTAIRANAQVIVTSDRDFTEESLSEWDIEAKTPDEFLLNQIGIDDRIVYSCVQEIANSRSRPPRTTADVLTELENSGLVATAAALRTPLS
jgi:hypothetical protein